MAGAFGKILIFVVAGVRFAIDLDHVVEVLEQPTGRLDQQRNDLNHGIIAALTFRQTSIPVIDPSLSLGLVSGIDLLQRTALVLRSSEGNWAILVDAVEGLVPASKVEMAHVSELLKQASGFVGVKVMLLEDKPLMVFEPERYYGITRAEA